MVKFYFLFCLEGVLMAAPQIIDILDIFAAIMFYGGLIGMVVIGLYMLYEKFNMPFPFYSKRPISMISVVKLAEKKKWDFSSNSLEVIDLSDALRSLAHSGDIVIRGKEQKIGAETLSRNSPLTSIPKEYWENNLLSLIETLKFTSNGTRNGFSNDNYPVHTTTVNDKTYKDLHVVCDNIHKWLRVAKKEFKGRRQEQNNGQ